MPEYHVSVKGTLKTDIFKKVEDAKSYAFDLATTGKTVLFDVVCLTEADVMEYAGRDGVARYLDDPDASVFERFEFKMNCVGMIA